MILQLMDDLRAYFERIPRPTAEEQLLLGRLNEGYVPITYVRREDLARIGFNFRYISDGDMESLAGKMADDYYDQLFWQSLEIIASYALQLPK